MCERKIYDLVQ